jgi:glutaminyl-tRNA synthetase
VQISEAVNYYKKCKKAEDFSVDALKAAAGAGVVVTQADVDTAVAVLIKENEAALLEQRYRFVPKLLGKLNQALKFADGSARKNTWDAAILALLGEKTAADSAKPVKAKKAPAAGGKAAAKEKKPEVEDKSVDDKTLFAMIDSGRPIQEMYNTDDQQARWQKATKGKVLTRFPPEPNGFLHLGHAKGGCAIARVRHHCVFLLLLHVDVVTD